MTNNKKNISRTEKNNKKTTSITDIDLIKRYILRRSKSMFDYISKSNSHFTLWYKNLTHSDLTNRGKRNGMKEGLDKNYLYYLTVQEIHIIEQNQNKAFESAKQSNIGLPEKFYFDLGVPRLQRRKGPQNTQHEHININDYADVKLVNDTMTYFTMDYTNKVLNALAKKEQWSDSQTVCLSEEEFTDIQLSEAIHGLGTSHDTEFHKLRLSMFLNDTIIFLIEHNKEKNKLFIMLEKNPRFFTLVGLSNKNWENYLEIERNQEEANIKSNIKLGVEDEKTRSHQTVWKEMLAHEMMNYTTFEGQVFCPFTQISADFASCSMLFIASHIKRFADSDSSEAFDVNNGLLLCANADALFDKHMITVDENKNLIFSFLIDKDYQLKQKLMLNQPIFNLILNDKRMEYMEDHRKKFFEKEEIRKHSSI